MSQQLLLLLLLLMLLLQLLPLLIKVKFTLEQTTKAHRGSRSIAVLFL